MKSISKQQVIESVEQFLMSVEEESSLEQCLDHDIVSTFEAVEEILGVTESDFVRETIMSL